MPNTIRNKVIEIFETMLDKKINSNENITKDNEEKWDSFFHITLILTLEEEFNVSFNSNDIPNLTSLEKIITAVKELKNDNSII